MPVPSNLTDSPIEGARAPTSRIASDTGKLRDKANALWFYVFYPDHPGNWFPATIDAADGVPDEDVGTWWFPQLQTETTQAGINNHKLLRKGQRPETIYDTAHMLIRRDNGVVLPQSLGYVKEVDCIDPQTEQPGVRYVDVFSTPRKVKIRGQRQKYDFDRQRYYRWLLSLMRSGELPVPDPEILEPRQAQFAQRIERIEEETGYAPGVQEKKLAIAAELSDKAETAKIVGSEPEVPPAKPARTRKPDAP